VRRYIDTASDEAVSVSLEALEALKTNSTGIEKEEKGSYFVGLKCLMSLIEPSRFSLGLKTAFTFMPIFTSSGSMPSSLWMRPPSAPSIFIIA